MRINHHKVENHILFNTKIIERWGGKFIFWKKKLKESFCLREKVVFKIAFEYLLIFLDC